jgi:uncharacterized membrane protein YkoI
MTQRMALILASVLTAFLLVLSGGVIARVSQGDVTTAAAAPVAATPASTDTQASDTAAQVQAIIQEREAAYRDLIRQANERLQAAEQQAAAAPAAQPAAARSTAVQAKPADAASATPTYAISADAAVGIANGVVSGMAMVRGPELVLFDGHVAYEIVFKHGNVYVDANTGQVLFNGTKHGGNGGGQPAASTPSSSGGEHEHESESEHGSND